MNVPGRTEGNWRWRVMPRQLSEADFLWLKNLTKMSNRQSRTPFPVVGAA
jgi:hypothetical protein